MTQCCTISNPSSNVVTLMTQKQHMLESLSDFGNEAHDLINPPPEHTCATSITITLETLEQALKSLPKTFCFKVIVPEQDTKTFTDDQIKVLQAQNMLNNHPIAKIYHETYMGTDQDDIGVMVVDTDQPQLPLVNYVKACMNIINVNKLIIITVGKKSITEPWSVALKEQHVEHKILEYLPPEEVLAFLCACKNHILSGCDIGLHGALISNSTNTVRPHPWTPGQDLDKLPLTWQSVNCGWSYTEYFDQSYYINLERRTDRMQHMQNQLQRFGLASARINAIDGKELTWKPEYGVLSNYWNTGAFAYCLSYRVAIIDAIKKGYDKVLIMDDDCVLQDNLWQVLEHAWKDLPEEWHMLYLGANHGHPQPLNVPTEQDRIGDYLYRLKGSMGSHAIILHKSCFQTILNFTAAPYAPLDMFLSMYQKFFPCYITYPGLASQLPGVSDIINKEVNYTKDWGVNYINHIPGRT